MSDPHPPQHAPKHADGMTTLISNSLAIVGFLILVVIIVWGLFHIASLSSGWFSTFNTSRTSTITLTAPATAASGQPVRLSWSSNTSGGRYAFLYACDDGVEFGIPVIKQGDTHASLARVPCGESFTLGNATSSLIVVPVLATTTPATAQMTILFTPSSGDASKMIHGSAKMAVTSATAPTTPEKPVVTDIPPAEKPTPATPTPRPTGPADLTVTILAANTDSNGMSIVTFDIGNRGDVSTGTYYFTATLPTSQPYTFVSDPQMSLAPGAHIENTLRFSQSVTGTFTVIVDPSNSVREANENNNVTSQELVMPYINYNAYNYNPNYNNGYPVYTY